MLAGWRDLLADDAPSGLPVARLDLQGAGDGLPQVWLAGSNVQDGDADEGHLYAALLPQPHVTHGALVRLRRAAPEKFCWPVVKVCTVSKVCTTQLARLPDISQTGQHGHFPGVIFTDAVKLLPALCVSPAHAVEFRAQFPTH